MTMWDIREPPLPGFLSRVNYSQGFSYICPFIYLLIEMVPLILFTRLHFRQGGGRLSDTGKKRQNTGGERWKSKLG